MSTHSLVWACQLNCDFRTLPNISKHPRTAINCSLLGGDESWRPSASAALKLNCNYFQISTEFLVKSNAAVLSLQCLYLSFRHFPSWRKFNSNNYHHQSNWDGLNELILLLAWELSDDAISITVNLGIKCSSKITFVANRGLIWRCKMNRISTLGIIRWCRISKWCLDVTSLLSGSDNMESLLVKIWRMFWVALEWYLEERCRCLKRRSWALQHALWAETKILRFISFLGEFLNNRKLW